ncbi:MAG: hypothetical protein J0H99_08790, partial [Rhodospirillales bacterium]|nr:hypothetical protein [Rhodospirillales bacterium]
MSATQQVGHAVREKAIGRDSALAQPRGRADPSDQGEPEVPVNRCVGRLIERLEKEVDLLRVEDQV